MIIYCIHIQCWSNITRTYHNLPFWALLCCNDNDNLRAIPGKQQAISKLIMLSTKHWLCANVWKITQLILICFSAIAMQKIMLHSTCSLCCVRKYLFLATTQSQFRLILKPVSVSPLCICLLLADTCFQNATFLQRFQLAMVCVLDDQFPQHPLVVLPSSALSKSVSAYLWAVSCPWSALSCASPLCLITGHKNWIYCAFGTCFKLHVMEEQWEDGEGKNTTMKINFNY